MRICVAIASKLREHSSGLVSGDARASPKRHVLLRMRHAGKSRGRFLAAGKVVEIHRGNVGQRIADYHDAQPVIERRALDGNRFDGLGMAAYQENGGDEQCTVEGAHLFSFSRTVMESVTFGWLARS